MQKAKLPDMVAQFLHWEQASRDTIDFKKSYVDMAGDLIAGLVLSQIVYWHLPGEKGTTRLKVTHDNQLWLAKARNDWYNEVRVSPKQLDRALKVLVERHLIITALYHYNGVPTKHIRINWSMFIENFNHLILPKGKNGKPSILPKGKNAFSPKGKNHIPQRVKSLTESTTESTTENPLLPPSATTKKSSPSEKLDKNLLTGMRTPTPIRVPTSSPKLPPPPKPVAKPVPKPAAKPTGKKNRKPQPTDVLWNAIADCFFDGARVGNQRLARILFGQENHGLFGLIAYEIEHQNTQILDFEMLAFLVPKFKESLPDDPKRTDSRGKPMKLELRDPAKFIERWIGWRCTTPNGHTSEPPSLNYDPACPHGCDKGIVYFTDEKGQTATRYCTCRVKILEARKGRVL